jgi:thiamine-phosphate pyrophosphorylase
MKQLIVISHPEMLSGEADIINNLFASGLARLHVRKLGAGEAGLRAFLKNIEPAFRERIALHQHHALAGEFGITGLHFTERSRLAQSLEELEVLKSNGNVLSTSLHDPADLDQLSHCFDYAFLGPVFDSISKEGYSSKLPADFKLKKYSFPGKVIALGGIRAENLKSAENMGFDGAAVLGSIWQNPEKALAQFRHLSLLQSSKLPGLRSGAKDIDRLHFISQENERMSHIDSIRLALEAGCRWIQLRVKNRPEEEVLPIALEATSLCDSYGARVIINDFPLVALAVGSYGLHLGLTDMPVPEARALVGGEMVIGGTANTWEDVVRRVDEGADYVGLGPFRFTNTKQNLSPVLGLEGYAPLLERMQEAGHSTPIIAIGGITPDDIGKLRAAGVHGVAMSAALVAAADPQKTHHQIQQALC